MLFTGRKTPKLPGKSHYVCVYSLIQNIVNRERLFYKATVILLHPSSTLCSLRKAWYRGWLGQGPEALESLLRVVIQITRRYGCQAETPGAIRICCCSLATHCLSMLQLFRNKQGMLGNSHRGVLWKKNTCRVDMCHWIFPALIYPTGFCSNCVHRPACWSNISALWGLCC